LQKGSLSPQTKSDSSLLENQYVPVWNYAARIVIKSVQAIEQEIEGVRKGQEIESVHRMRVASRRIRTALDVFEKYIPPKKKSEWFSNLRNLAKSLGETRDTDVQIHLLKNIHRTLPELSYRPGIKRLLLRLQQRRVKLQKGILDSLDLLKKKKVLIKISEKFSPPLIKNGNNDPCSPELYKIAFDSILKRLNQFLYYEIYLHNPEFIKELHQMRIAAKKLRYSMEIFSLLYADHLELAIKSTRQAQQILGEIHDCDVWIYYLPEFIEKEKIRIQRYLGHTRSIKMLLPGIHFFQKNRQEERSKQFCKFQQMWQKWQQEELWSSLREKLFKMLPPSKDHTPFLPPF
jgi:CHAD domain-containing protein